MFNSPIPVIDGETGEEVFLGVVPPWCLVIDATRRKQLAGGTFGFPCALIVKRFAKGERHDKATLNAVLGHPVVPVRTSSREALDPTTAVAIAVGVLAVRNAVGEPLVLPVLYVPVNLATAALLAIVSCSAGLSAGELGLSRAAAPRGVVVGVAVAAIVVAGIAVGAAMPLTRPWFEDQRIADVDTAVELAYQALIRIPLGTAVLEEFAFRGVLLGLLARTGPTKTAVGVSSLLFGLWHIRPTLGALATNDLAESAWAQVGAVTAAVALTTVGGLLFCALRLASRSLVAPLIVHAATNSAAIAAAYVVLHGA
ncbi:MAG TPA: CPBP family glutamic-type intramembrane protease [Acidimicrobiales bacterium]|nr:CPBP family glutamic-type intramembrane protease [Acidimicrobiales bacterium]